MKNKILKTSEEWINHKDYAGLTIIQASGWPLEPSEFEFHWFKELIDSSEFEHRLYRSNIKWSFSKL